MFIKTLPTKEKKFMNQPRLTSAVRKLSAHDGVFSLGIHLKDPSPNSNNNPMLFEGVSVYLCGSGWKKSPAKTKDVHLLLKESGATLLNSASIVTKTLTKGLESGSKLVLLCDGKISSVSNMFPKKLKETVEHATRESNHILIVNTTWLFDCISCAEVLSAKHYEPTGSIVQSLWKGCLEVEA